MKNHVTSLALSKKLKKLGVKQESNFYWCEDLEDFTFSKNCKPFQERTCGDHASVFLSSELGEMLKDSCKTYWYEATSEYVTEKGFGMEREPEFKKGKTEPEARGKMLVYLLENNLL